MKFTLKIFFAGLITLISININYSQINSGVITYKAYPARKPISELQEVSSFIKKTDDELKKLTFTLKFNQDESIFQYNKKLEVENTSKFYNMALAMAGVSNRVWYSNNKSEITVKQYEFMGELFLISNYFKDIKWTLTKESKTIGKHLVYKATCKLPILGSKGKGERPYEAWYTPKIPINVGPLGLNGLPGLILEFSFHRIKYVVNEIKLNPEKNITIKKPNKGQNISQTEFLEIAEKKIKQFNKEIGRE